MPKLYQCVFLNNPPLTDGQCLRNQQHIRPNRRNTPTLLVLSSFCTPSLDFLLHTDFLVLMSILQCLTGFSVSVSILVSELPFLSNFNHPDFLIPLYTWSVSNWCCTAFLGMEIWFLRCLDVLKTFPRLPSYPALRVLTSHLSDSRTDGQWLPALICSSLPPTFKWWVLWWNIS